MFLPERFLELGFYRHLKAHEHRGGGTNNRSVPCRNIRPKRRQSDKDVRSFKTYNNFAYYFNIYYIQFTMETGPEFLQGGTF